MFLLSKQGDILAVCFTQGIHIEFNICRCKKIGFFFLFLLDFQTSTLLDQPTGLNKTQILKLDIRQQFKGLWSM